MTAVSERTADMAVPVALIQGSSRGIGLEFCRHILKNKTPVTVIATCRNPDGAADLRSLAEQHRDRVTVLKLDVNQEEDIRGAADRVQGSFGRLDLMVNTSAMLHPSGKGETSLRDVSAQVCQLEVVVIMSSVLVRFCWRSHWRSLM